MSAQTGPASLERWCDKWLHRITVPLIVLVTGYMLVWVRPQRFDLAADPSFTDILFHNRAVVLAAWIILIDGAIFLFASLVARSSRRDWANRAGPVATPDDSDQPKTLTEVPAAWARDNDRARARIDDLERELEATQADYESAVDELRERERELADCRKRIRSLEAPADG